MDYSDPPKEIINNLLYKINQSKYNEVLSEISTIKNDFPNSYALSSLSGIAYSNLKEFKQAIMSFQNAVSIVPDFPDAHNNLGKIFFEIEQIDKSINCYKKAISLNEKFAIAHNNLAIAYLSKNSFTNSFMHSIKSLELEPNNKNYLFIFGTVIKNIVFQNKNENLYPFLINILKFKYIRSKDIALSVISLIKQDNRIKKLLSIDLQNFELYDIEEDLIELAKFDLFIILLKTCPLPDLKIEKLLTKIRSKLLTSKPDNYKFQNYKNFINALSIQLFINEYIYDYTKEEEKVIVSLINKFKHKHDISEYEVLCLSLYSKLNEIKNIIIIKKIISSKELIDILIEEPNIEKDFAKKIISISDVKDDTSIKVREQYENFPYPKWINPGMSIYSQTVDDYFSERKIKINKKTFPLHDTLEILIAGCGTGQQAINSCTKFSKSNVTAIDLSRCSLGYAQRKSNQLDIQIDYIHGDILEIEKIRKKFDLIECIGVLHHMNEPEKGLSSLLNILKEGGMIFLGLYSRLARKNIHDYRKEFLQSKHNINFNNIKKIRETIIQRNSPQDKNLFYSEDFYSTSEFRDLICHVQEHTFNINEIIKILDRNNLKFCGFENSILINRFKQYDSKNDIFNLNHWNNFEINNPLSFAGMYQFWCQKS